MRSSGATDWGVPTICSCLFPPERQAAAMAYSRFIGLVALRTRGAVLLVAVAFAGFASVQLPAVTKAASRDEAAANGIYQCLPEPEGGCVRILRRSACLAHPRCQWAEGGAGNGLCRRIYCWE